MTLAIAIAALLVSLIACAAVVVFMLAPDRFVRFGDEIYVTAPDEKLPGVVNATKVRLYREEQLGTEGER